MKWAWKTGVWLYRLFAVVVIFANLRLYCASPLAGGINQSPASIVSQLNAGKSALKRGSADEMQMYFPEGYYFSYLYHGLTWIEVALRDPRYTDRAIDEAKWAWNHLDSSAGKSAFPKSLPPEHGMFYSSWKTHLLAGIVLLQHAQSEHELQRLQFDCDQLAAAIKSSATPFLPS